MQQLLASITTKGQVTIPAEVRRLLGVRPHEKIAFVIEENLVRLAPAKSVVAQTAGLLKGSQPALSPRQEEAAVEETIAEEVEKLP